MAKAPSPRAGMFAGDRNPIWSLPDPGKCIPNVRTFTQNHWADAQRIAAALRNDVTPTEVLATAGNEAQWGSLKKGLARYGNFFGLHGSGPAGTYYTTANHTPTAKFPVDKGFPQSGAVFTRNLGPWMSPAWPKTVRFLYGPEQARIRHRQPELSRDHDQHRQRRARCLHAGAGLHRAALTRFPQPCEPGPSQAWG